VYGGSEDYKGSSDSSITECFDVRDITSLETAQSWVPNDTATITATGDSRLTGSVTFTLYESANCTAVDEDDDGDPDNVLYSKSFPLTNADSPAIVTSDNTGAVTSDTDVSWATTFSSSDPDTASSSGHCEASQLVIDNDITD
jgi:hypothetical protein